MGTKFVALATALFASLSICTAQAAEPKHGGILHIYHRETPPSLSIHEEATFSVNVPAMGIFNNLVIYDQHIPQTSAATIARNWRRAGPGTRRIPRSPSSCGRTSNGMTACRSPPRT